MFSFFATYFPLLSVCQRLWFGVTMLNGDVDTWFASKQCFFQVISLRSKKPVLLCFFRHWWVRLPAELERLPVWGFLFPIPDL